MQPEPVLLQALLDERESTQILERDQNAGHFTAAEPFLMPGLRHLLAHALRSALGHIDPGFDELGIHPLRHTLEQGLDAAALAMALHDDVLHVQRADGKLQRRADAVIAAAFFVGRHQVRHIADDEQIAGLAIEDDRWIDAGIGAGDHQGARALALCQFGKKLLAFIDKIVIMKTPITIDQFFYIAHCSLPSLLCALHSATTPWGMTFRARKINMGTTIKSSSCPISGMKSGIRSNGNST